MFTSPLIRRTLTLTLGAALGVMTLATPAFAAPTKSKPAHHDPSGNNGTVKIDGEAFDDAPDNEPHVGCTFQVDFYGFDQGDHHASVSFEGHAPTGGGTLIPDQGADSLTVFVGEDAAGGGTDLDASATYSLTSALAGVEPHPKQGYHVKLTVHAPYARGNDVKHKVFWVAPCAPAPAAEESEEKPKHEPKAKHEPEPEPTPEPVEKAPTVVSSVEVLPVVPAVITLSAIEAPAAPVTLVTEDASSVMFVAAAKSVPNAGSVPHKRATEVLGVEYTKGEASGESLALTGASLRTIVLTALFALSIGMALVATGRRRARI